MHRVSLRPAAEQDEDFQLQVYASTRAEELALTGWPESAQDAFVRMQFLAQNRHYAAAYPGAQIFIILLEDRPAGRLIVHAGPAEIRLVDIALLPEFRGQGAGAEILRDLQAQARTAGKVLRLNVQTGGRALRLYERLGFVAVQADAMYTEMEWVERSLMQALPEKDGFQEHLNSVFELTLTPGQVLDVRLVDLRGGRPDPRVEQFSLLFQGPQEPLLPQQVYHLRQAEMGEMDLFLVPVGRDAGGSYYEAVFNRLKSG